MSVSNIKAKLYEDYRAEGSAPKTENSGFEGVIDAAVQKASVSKPCRSCVRVAEPEVTEPVEVVVADANAVNPAKTDVAAVAKDANPETEVQAKAVDAIAASPETNHSAMYRFTMYVRISGDFGGIQQSLADDFKDATRNFVSFLKGEKQSGIEALDGYLGKAETVASTGLESSKAFLDEILAAANNGLKAISSSITSSAWSSGLNLSGSSTSSLSAMFASSSSSSSSSSNSLFSSPALDMAKVQLQAAMEKSLKTGSGAQTPSSAASAEMVDYGSGYSLAKVNATPDLVKVNSSGAAAGGSAANTDAIAEDEAAKATSATATSATATSTNGWLVKRDAILDKFLQLIDGLSSSLENSSQMVRAGFSFSMDKGIFTNHMEGGKAIENVDKSSSDNKKEDAETATAAEEIVV